MNSVRKKEKSKPDRPLGDALIIDINFFVVHNICITLKLYIGIAPRSLEATSGRAYTL